jgi:hypothetical protein
LQIGSGSVWNLHSLTCLALSMEPCDTAGSFLGAVCNMPWWLPLGRSSRRDWSAEEKTAFFRIAITGLAIFFPAALFVDIQVKRHGGLSIGAFPAFIFMALVWLMSVYVSRVVWEFLTPTLIKRADANAAMRRSK